MTSFLKSINIVLISSVIALFNFVEPKIQSQYIDDITKSNTIQKVAVTVNMTNRLKFEPRKIKIKVGDKVLWKNGSFVVHTVTCDPDEATKKGSVILPVNAKAFNSGRISPGSEFTHTFNKPGTYKYFCIPHEGANMTGTIVVEK